MRFTTKDKWKAFWRLYRISKRDINLWPDAYGAFQVLFWNDYEMFRWLWVAENGDCRPPGLSYSQCIKMWRAGCRSDYIRRRIWG